MQYLMKRDDQAIYVYGAVDYAWWAHQSPTRIPLPIVEFAQHIESPGEIKSIAHPTIVPQTLLEFAFCRYQVAQDHVDPPQKPMAKRLFRFIPMRFGDGQGLSKPGFGFTRRLELTTAVREHSG
jgi:hypothetical protein